MNRWPPIRSRRASVTQRVDGRALSVVLLRAGRDALGLEDTSDDAPTPRAAESQKTEPDEGTLVSLKPRSGGKHALIVSMLSEPSGTSLDELMAASGWLARTTPAALSGNVAPLRAG